MRDWWYDRYIFKDLSTISYDLESQVTVLNMTIDNIIAATGFALAITHDLCDQSCARSTICPQFQFVAVAATDRDRGPVL